MFIRLKAHIWFALLLSLTLLSLLIAQETIIDTVYSYADIDGAVGYNTSWDFYYSGTDYVAGIVGDWYDNLEGGRCYTRLFLSFAKPDIPDGYSLSSAILHIYQQTCRGNGVSGVYPIFNFEGYDIEPQCLIEHIRYGYSLGPEDFDIPALSQPLVLSTTPDQSWRVLDITEWVVEDLDEVFHYTQSRLRLMYNMDNDYLADYLYFSLGNCWTNPPYIEYTIEPESSVAEEIGNNSLEFSISPNPIGEGGKIMFSSKSSGKDMEFEIYNVKGQQVMNLGAITSVRGEQELHLDSSHLPSGIYFLKCTQNEKKVIKKFMVMK